MKKNHLINHFGALTLRALYAMCKDAQSRIT